MQGSIKEEKVGQLVKLICLYGAVCLCTFPFWGVITEVIVCVIKFVIIKSQNRTN